MNTLQPGLERSPIAILMGSANDWDVLAEAYATLNALQIACVVRVVSAHRMPDDMLHISDNARASGLKVIIAGAGGAAHLPGMIAAKTTVPVLGVPMPTQYLNGVDSLYSIVQMPKGVPVATFAIGAAGAVNAALFAAAILANEDPEVLARLEAYRDEQTAAARAMTATLRL